MNPVAPLASASCVPTGRLRLRVLSPSTAVGQLRSGQINWRCSGRRETDPLRRLLFFDPAPESERRKHVSQGRSESASRGALVGAHGLAAVRLGVLRPLLQQLVHVLVQGGERVSGGVAPRLLEHALRIVGRIRRVLATCGSLPCRTMRSRPARGRARHRPRRARTSRGRSTGS